MEQKSGQLILLPCLTENVQRQNWSGRCLSTTEPIAELTVRDADFFV